MATRDTGQPASGVTRRDFLKASAIAGTVAGCGLSYAYDPEKAAAYEYDTVNYKVTNTTCPYCSASCGQRVVVGLTAPNIGKVVDIYGDFESPMNSGGLCAKGAGTLQLVTNPRRIGAWATHPENPVFAYDGTFSDGIAYKRTGDGAWGKISLDTAMGEIAGRLKTARGPMGAASSSSPLTSPTTVDSVAYTGFSGLMAVRKADGSFYVSTNGCKVDAPTLTGLLTGLPGTAAALMAAFDELVWSASDPRDYSTWTFQGRGDAATVLAANGAMGNTADIVRDGSTYFAYVCDPTGTMHRIQSTDMMTWSGYANLGAPGNTAGIKSPTIIKSGNNLKVWSNRFSAPGVEDNTLWYSTYDGTSWTAAVAVTHGGSQLPAFSGHPYVRANSTGFTLWFSNGGAVLSSTAPTATPNAFAAASTVCTDTSNIGNIVAPEDGWVGYTVYNTPGDPLGWAFASIKSFTSATNNTKRVAFFGSSHMNNESNYLYRKVIANFGTSNVEHQARI